MRYLKNIELDYTDTYLQYDGIDFDEQDIVEAEYVEAPGFQGYPDICALPRPYKGKDAYNRGMFIPPLLTDHEADISLRIDSMRHIRFPVLIQGQINEKIYNNTVLSYYHRRMAVTERTVEVPVMNGMIPVNTLSTAHGEHTTLGSAIIGLPGTGKTTAINIYLKDIPHAILHHTSDGGHYIQIPFVRTSAFAESNVTALLSSFATVLDTYLDAGNRHHSEMRKRRTIGEKTDLICEWISLYHIGTWIIEELSFFNFSDNKSNSFENIITIVDRTGIALFATANDELYEKVKSNLRIERRFLGDHFNMNMVANNKEYMIRVIQNMWKSIVPDISNHGPTGSEEQHKLFQKIYEETYGSIDLISILLICVQHEYLTQCKKQGGAKKDLVIDVDFISKVSAKKIRHMSKLFLENTLLSHRAYMGERDNFDSHLKKMVNDQTDVYIEEMEDDYLAGYDHTRVLNAIIKSLQEWTDDYSKKQIESAFCYLETKESGWKRKTDKERKRLLIQLLEERKDNKNKQRKGREKMRIQKEKENIDGLYQDLLGSAAVS